MFQKEKQDLEGQIKKILQEADIPVPEDLGWAPIPFSGEWGIATSFFRSQLWKPKVAR